MPAISVAKTRLVAAVAQEQVLTQYANTELSCSNGVHHKKY
jgi:hypothetical protein